MIRFTKTIRTQPKQQISAEVISFSEQNLAAVVRNFRRRPEMVMDADAAHVDCVIVSLSKLLNSETQNTVMFGKVIYAVKTRVSF
jgi:hypothetical protein